ncbi:DUF1062 domain-containing protein [Peptostreptococcus faecalis]|uniref:DUF1062 domain-containing protein n=1 Tax=Peptostreptococcus faecalis TaxID=2045015 RepID=UPI001FA8EFB3|nr:DUF1062 domain-containing protein [Peptostreptococcus faecalis]
MINSKEITTIIWNVEYCTPPAILRYCKKCGKKREYVCSGEFRINAQQKVLDVWLIYKCVQCNTTWNSSIYSRVSPQSLGVDLLERFHNNDAFLALQYAMNISILHKNGVEIKMPAYNIIGEDTSLENSVIIKIKSQYILPLKISSVLRTKLNLSRREFENLVSNNKIQSITDQNLKKGKLLSSETIILISNT